MRHRCPVQCHSRPHLRSNNVRAPAVIGRCCQARHEYALGRTASAAAITTAVGMPRPAGELGSQQPIVVLPAVLGKIWVEASSHAPRIRRQRETHANGSAHDMRRGNGPESRAGSAQMRMVASREHSRSAQNWCRPVPSIARPPGVSDHGVIVQHCNAGRIRDAQPAPALAPTLTLRADASGRMPGA